MERRKKETFIDVAISFVKLPCGLVLVFRVYDFFAV